MKKEIISEIVIWSLVSILMLVVIVVLFCIISEFSFFIYAMLGMAFIIFGLSLICVIRDTITLTRLAKTMKNDLNSKEEN